MDVHKSIWLFGLCKGVKRLAPKPIIQNKQNTDSKLITQSILQSEGCNYRFYTKSFKTDLYKENFNLSFKLLATSSK